MRHILKRLADYRKWDLFILLPGFALILLAGLWGAVWHQLAEERALARHATLIKSQTLAHTFAETTLSVLQQVEHASQLYKLRYELSGQRVTLAAFMRNEGGLNAALPTDVDFQMTIFDANGRQVESSRPFAATNVASQSWFKNHAARPSDAPLIAKPLRIEAGVDTAVGANVGAGAAALAARQQPWLIRISRRLNHPDGCFAGVLVTDLDPGQFVDHFDTGDMGAQGAVLLFSPLEKRSLYRIKDQWVFGQDLEITSGGNATGSSGGNLEQRFLRGQLDHTLRLYCVRAMAEYGLVAAVGLTEDEALIPWQRHQQRYHLAAAVITLLVLLFIAMLMRQGQRLQAAVRQVRESEARLHTIANTMPAMVAYIDAQERHRFHNQAYEAYLGPDSQQTLGKTVREVVGEERYRFFEPYIRRALAGEALVYQQESELDGAYRCLESHYIPQFSPDGKEVLGFHVMRQDITAKKLEEMRLLQLAQYDALCGLCNRAGFQLRLFEAIKHSRDHTSLLALMYLDIDHFKSVNDNHGHKAGDALLQAFATRLAQVFRSSDTVARLGGDEFTVIMENLHTDNDACHLAEKVVAAMQAPFVLDSLSLRVSTSIGVAFFRGGAQTAEELIHEADMMLYQAKRGGRNRFVVSGGDAGGVGKD